MNTTEHPRPTNHLANETSPYLLQHVHNPVDWYPWTEEALKKARKEDKPIFLSIGYSACHWCHVMERESFENPEVAEILNRHFVSIKVDREERPDLDEIYMTAVQLLTGSGGWPMSVFLTPELQPFYGGTYFPPENRYGRVGFITLLERVAELWDRKRSDLMQSAGEITRAIAGHAAAQPAAQGPLRRELIEQAANRLEQAFDADGGGFGEAPKFPPVAALQLLMRRHAHTSSDSALTMVRHTLNRMAQGGVYDQVGGGFHRYSVDAQWLVPHFEKMLYDNAQLAEVYTAAWQLTREDTYRTVAIETLDYVLRDMTHERGAFFSSEDADSEGKEGLFYVWTPDELRTVLGEPDADLAMAFWGVTDAGNFEGANILHVPIPLKTFAKEHDLAPDMLDERIRRWKARLLEARASRTRPGRDDKVITAWNGLMISAFAKGGRAFGRTLYVEAARRAARFILSEMVRDDVLYRTWRDGTARRPAYLDDYAFFIQGMLDLYESEGAAEWLDEAGRWADRMLAEFKDEKGGGLFYTSARLHRDVLVRSKSAHDGSEPSANAVAAHALLRLSALTGREDPGEEGERLLNAHAGHMERMPSGMLNMLAAYDYFSGPRREIVLAGDPGDPQWNALRRVVAESYLPNAVLAYSFPGEDRSNQVLLQGKEPVDGRAAVYVCRNQTCQAPVCEPDALKRELT